MSNNVSGQAYALTILSPIKHERIQSKIPLRDGEKPAMSDGEISSVDYIRNRLEQWNFEPNSPMAKVPQTYLCRFYILDDVYTESLPGADLRSMASDLHSIISNKARVNQLPKEDHLQSSYLVFSCNFHWTAKQNSSESFFCKLWKKSKEKLCGPEGDVDTYLHAMWNAISQDILDIWGHCYGFDGVDDASKFVAYMKKCQRNAALFFNGSNDQPLAEQLKALYLKQEFAKFATENQGLSPRQLRENFNAFIARVQPSNLAEPTWAAGKYR